MARRLAVLIPSRGRPNRVAETIAAYKKTCQGDYQICWAFDDDDPTLEECKAAAGTGDGRSYIWTGPRDGLAGWTNKLWRELEGEFEYYASFGDDHLPITHGWDIRLTTVLDECGGGFAYCDNGQHTPELDWNLPEMCVISGPILSALGWMCEPSLLHFNVDSVWHDLGAEADCLYYVPDVIIRHRHWVFRDGPRDDTYFEATLRGREDVINHGKWQQERMAADAQTVRTAVAKMKAERLWPGTGGSCYSPSAGSCSALAWGHGWGSTSRLGRGGNNARMGSLQVA